MVAELNEESVKSGIHLDPRKTAHLIEKDGGATKRKEFMRLPVSTQQKLTRCLRILKTVPEDFITAEVRDDLQALGVGDWQRYLFMLYQAGFLRREPDIGKRLKYTKTELAMGDEAAIARNLHDLRDKLDDYETKPDQRAKKAQVDYDESGPAEEITIVMKDSEIDWDGIKRKRDAKWSREEPTEEKVVPDEKPATEPEPVAKEAPEPVVPVVKPAVTEEPRQTDIPDEFVPVIEAWKGVKAYLPGISVKDFLVMYIRSQDKGNDSPV